MYLIVGANGFLGSYVIRNILEATNDNVVAICRNACGIMDTERIKWVSCDIGDYFQVDKLCKAFNKCRNIKVIFLSAYHNPDKVEANRHFAWNVNVTSLSYFVNRLENVECFFYPSTDSVYGNSLDGYHFKENDKLTPVNEYGKQKCAAESVVNWYGYNIVRFPFLIAPSLAPNKEHFYDIVVKDLMLGKQVKMFSDSYRSTLNFDTAASILIRIIEDYSRNTPKILNICGDEDLSKYDVGLLIAKKLKVPEDLIVPVKIGELGDVFKTRRAISTLMDNSLLKEYLHLDKISFII